jgi:hypothetical protein
VQPAVLNVALALAMTFGKDWLKPVQPRLASRYPDLSRSELDECDAVCREVLALGRKQAPVCWQQAGAQKSRGPEQFRLAVHARFPWVSSENLSHLFSQGCYYAWKNGDLS